MFIWILHGFIFLIEFLLRIFNFMFLVIVLYEWLLFLFACLMDMWDFTYLILIFKVFGGFFKRSLLIEAFLLFGLSYLFFKCLSWSCLLIFSWFLDFFIIVIVKALFDNFMFLIYIHHDFYLISTIFRIQRIQFMLILSIRTRILSLL